MMMMIGRSSPPFATTRTWTFWISLQLLLWGCSSSSSSLTKPPERLRYAMMSGASDFFLPCEDGWKAKCQELEIGSCIYQKLDYDEQVKAGMTQCSYYIRKWIELQVDGIALVPCNAERDHAAIQEATNAGIPVITFDTDAPNSTRNAFVGTNNRFMGVSMARLLKQLRPEGGTYALVDNPQGGANVVERVDGFEAEIQKDNDREDRAHWYPVDRHENFYDMGIMERMEDYATKMPSAMVTFYQSPMRDGNWTFFVDKHRHKNITYIGTDSSDYQLEYLTHRYVHGLVGQLPYDMAAVSMKVLHELINTGSLKEDHYGTNLVAYNMIPLELPILEVDQNLLGNLKYVGFVCFCVAAMLAILCMVWTAYYMSDPVVLAAQPFFLMSIAVGVLIMASSMIPLSFDDKGIVPMPAARSTGICMSIPWLAFTGFTVAFSALSGKTWRVNKFFHSSAAFARIRVSERDVLAPFVFLLTSNFIVLICWTIIDPLMYHREFDDGTDFWNREISSTGSCKSDHLAAYLVPLGLINFTVVCIASWQAIQARDIESEFSESKYIGFAVMSVTQAFLTGVPIVAVVSHIPEVLYLVMTFMIFVVCMAVLLFIFLPKFFIQRTYAQMSRPEQRKALALSVRKSAVAKSSASWMAESNYSFSATKGTAEQGGSSGIGAPKDQLGMQCSKLYVIDSAAVSRDSTTGKDASVSGMRNEQPLEVQTSGYANKESSVFSEEIIFEKEQSQNQES